MSSSFCRAACKIFPCRNLKPLPLSSRLTSFLPHTQKTSQPITVHKEIILKTSKPHAVLLVSFYPYKGVSQRWKPTAVHAGQGWVGSHSFLSTWTNQCTSLRRGAVCRWCCISPPQPDDCFIEVSHHVVHGVLKQGHGLPVSSLFSSFHRRLFLFLFHGFLHPQAFGSGMCSFTGVVALPWVKLI